MAYKSNNENTNSGFFPNPVNDKRNTQRKATQVINSHIREHYDEWMKLPLTCEFCNSRGELTSRPEWERTHVAFLACLFGHTFNCNPYKNGLLHLPQDELSLKRLRKVLDYTLDNRDACLYREACYDRSVKGVGEWYHNMNINPYWKLVAGCRFIFTLDERQLDALKWEGVDRFNINVTIERVPSMLSYDELKKKKCIDVSLFEPKQMTIDDLFANINR